MTTVQTYIYLLRKIFGQEESAAESLLITKATGYVLAVPAASIDLFRFEAIAYEGRHALDRGDLELAGSKLGDALSLWRGPALADVQKGRLLEAHAARLEEGRVKALEQRLDIDLRLGRHREVISELKGLIACYPYHEVFHKLLMIALYRCGRQAEALDTYKRLRQVLVTGLQVEPSNDLQRIQSRILSADPDLDLGGRERRGGAPPSRAIRLPARTDAIPAGQYRPPAQLPPDIADFTGRVEAVAMAEEALAGDGTDSQAPRVVELIGKPGVGKTACAIRIAHRVRGSYPDGQLYASLRSGGDSVACETILRGFLRAMGLRDGEIPDHLDKRAEVFRARSAGRRLLVVLDDVTSAEQVTSLLPSGPRCGVLLTARTQLNGPLEAHEVKLDAMTEEECVELLTSVVGANRVKREPTAARQIVRLCDNLPLAVRAAGARVAAVPVLPLDQFCATLVDERQRLDQLDSFDFQVRARLEGIYRQLSEDEQFAAQWLALFANRVFTERAAMILLGRGWGSTKALLDRLVEIHFVRRFGGGGNDQGYYGFFELPRALLCGRAMDTLSESLRAC